MLCTQRRNWNLLGPLTDCPGTKCIEFRMNTHFQNAFIALFYNFWCAFRSCIFFCLKHKLSITICRQGCMRSKIRETVAMCKQLKSEKNIKFPTDDLKIGLPSSRVASLQLFMHKILASSRITEEKKIFLFTPFIFMNAISGLCHLTERGGR